MRLAGTGAGTIFIELGTDAAAPDLWADEAFTKHWLFNGRFFSAWFFRPVCFPLRWSATLRFINIHPHCQLCWEGIIHFLL